MAKKKIKQTQDKNLPQKSTKNKHQDKSNPNVLESVTSKKLRSRKASSLQVKKSNMNNENIDDFLNFEDEVQKSEFEVPIKTKKQISKKKKGKSLKGIQKSKNSGIKLQRGYKFCQNCQTVLNIHKYVCTQCGFIHNMKKHKFDVMKNLSKATPKIVKSIIESNQFNTINIKNCQGFRIFESSFELQSLLTGKEKCQSISQDKVLNKIQQESVKRRKFQGKTEKTTNNQTQSINQSNYFKGTETKRMNKIVFEKLKITKSDQFSTKVNQQQEKQKTNNQFNKTRQQFSIYKSKYPVICLQAIDISQNQENSFGSQRVLLFTQSVSKKQIFPVQTYSWDILGSNGNSVNQYRQNGDMVDQQMLDKKSLLKRQQLRQKKLKQEQEKEKLKKLRQNNSLTKKALNLQKYHKIGALYSGQTILNIMSLQTRKDKNGRRDQLNQEKQILQQTVKRRTSSRSAKNGKNKIDLYTIKVKKGQKGNALKNDPIDDLNDNEHNLLKIGLKEHVEMLKTVKNKVAILTGKKSILLMNVNLDWQNILQQNKNFANFQSETQQQNQDNVLFWLQNQDFCYQTNEQKKYTLKQSGQKSFRKHLSSISLSRQEIIRSQDDQFTVIQWLKNYNSHQNSYQNQNHQSYLITGTLFGHIIIYKVSPQNSYETYRSIIGAHFEMINCLSQCPLNINGSALFASASYDGSVKIWQLNHTSAISQFQVSNRKIQSIHWDSGAKFLLIVRDQGLQNCYLACFYSVNNRIQLPMMLTDTIDFRLIRNGLMFDNSCSPLISFAMNSKLVLMLNSRNGFLKILQSQELRKTSLKRKKSKKNYQQLLYHDYWIRMLSNQIQQKSQRLSESQYPQIVQMKSNCSDYINYAYACKAQLQLQDVAKPQAISMIEQQNNFNNDLSQNSQQLISKSQFQNRNVQHNKPLKNNPVKINKINPLPQSQPTGLRKSLRVRKPILQYNFMEEEQNQSQKSIHNKTIKSKQKNKNQKKISSDDQDFQNQSQDQSQQNFNQSDESFNNQEKIEKNKNHIQKVIKQTRNKTKQPSTKKQNEIRKSLRSKNEKNQTLDKKSQGQQMLYKLFWQQTNEESLVNKRDDYPSNKFPKFSAMTSFLTVQSQSQSMNQIQQKKEELNTDQAQQNLQTKTEYLTTFIAGYNGELIKVRVKIEGFHQTVQSKQTYQDQQEQSD